MLLSSSNGLFAITSKTSGQTFRTITMLSSHPQAIMAAHSATSSMIWNIGRGGSAAPVPAWVELCSQLAPGMSLILFAAPIPTVLQIIRDKNVGNLPLLPYSTMVANAVLWTAYGILRKEPSVYAANGIGMIMAIVYLLQFIRFAPSRSSTLPGSIQQHVTAILTVMIATAAMALLPLPAFIQNKSAADVIGSIAVLFCIGMFASPLAALRTVLQTKSASSIALPLAVASVANCFLWGVTGIFKMKDINITLPNVMGLASGLAQITLKIVYAKSSSPGNLKAL